MSDILIVTSYPPAWRDLAAITCASHKKYADRHGYDYHADCSDIRAPLRLPNWGAGVSGHIPIRGFVKLDLMLHFLDPKSCKREYEWVVWLDNDLLVTNCEIPLSRWTQYDAPLILPYDANAHNATVIMAENTDLTYDLLWACNNAGRSFFLHEDWAEMSALRLFLQTPPYAGMAHYVSVKELCGMPPNVYPIPERVRLKYEWEPGDFAVHFSALSLEKRVAMAKEWVERLGLLP